MSGVGACFQQTSAVDVAELAEVRYALAFAIGTLTDTKSPVQQEACVGLAAALAIVRKAHDDACDARVRS